MEILWFIPTHGDGRYLATSVGERPTTLHYLTQLARAVDELGYYGVLVPTGRPCDDPWVVASALIPATRQLRFLLALRPGLTSPTLAARMAASFDRLSGGRLMINVVAGGDPVELHGDGIFEDHDERYRVTEEYLQIWKRLFSGEEVDFKGRHLWVKGAKVLYPGLQTPHPPIYFGGSSEAGHDVAAKHADISITWGEPKQKVAEKIADLRRRAAVNGRTLRFAIRLHVIVRETAKEAWEAADRLLTYVTDDTIAAAQKIFQRFDSAGQQRMSDLHRGRRDNLEIAPNLWAGVGLVRGGAGTALVGSPEEVAERIHEYAEIGIEQFVLSGYPHLEEAYRFAELVFPLLPIRQAPQRIGPSYLSPFGELVANPESLAMPAAPVHPALRP